MLIKSKRDIVRLVWVLAISLGYDGNNGGIFTLRGGADRVWGPARSFIGHLIAAIIATPALLEQRISAGA